MKRGICLSLLNGSRLMWKFDNICIYIYIFKLIIMNEKKDVRDDDRLDDLRWSPHVWIFPAYLIGVIDVILNPESKSLS